MIGSETRAREILERVARKHDMQVASVLCARRDRFAVAARAEVAHLLKDELGWSLRRIGEQIGCSHRNVSELHRKYEIQGRRAKHALPAVDLHALLAIKEDKRLDALLASEERAVHAEDELRRLTGADLALKLANALSLTHRMRCAIVLAIVVEAYPRVVLGPALLELYDEACVRLNYGDQHGASFNLLTKNVAHLRTHFKENGWPLPILVNDAATHQLAGARRLTPEGAQFLHDRLGAPRPSQLEAAREARADRSDRHRQNRSRAAPQ